MNVVKILIVLGLLAVGVAVIANYSGGGGSGANTAQQADDQAGSGDAPRLEERYGFTGETLEP